jgi:DNA-binding FadR family transcriptional regulator
MDLPTQTFMRLEEMLDAPEWHSGGRLPSETQLSSQLGVSRPVLRKALAKLREQGRIVSRRGSANFVQPRAAPEEPEKSAADLTIHTVFDMRRCLDFRRVVEEGAAAAAALQCDQFAIAKIQDALNKMRVLPVGSNVFDCDFEFHMAVAEASMNPYFSHSLSALRSQIRLTIEFTRKLQDRPLDRVTPEVIVEHQDIVRAIADANPDQARAAMSRHMVNSCKRLFG